MKHIVHFFKGIIIGIATLVPGVSGGTMSIILGVYNEMIRAVSSFFKNIKSNIIFLGTLGIGGVVGIFGFSKIVEFCLDNYMLPTVYLFLGIILGGIPILYQKANQKKGHKIDWLYFIGGFALILVMTFYKGNLVNLAGSTGILNVIFLIIAGIIIAVALILPGISTSFLLLTLGLYDITIKAINNIELNYLIPIAIGALIGVITTTKILEKLLNEKPRQTYLLILGFVLGSIIEVFPGIPTNMNIIFSIITLVIGYVIIRYISKKYSD